MDLNVEGGVKSFLVKLLKVVKKCFSWRQNVEGN